MASFPLPINLSASVHNCLQLPLISKDMFDPYHSSVFEDLYLWNYQTLETVPDFLHNLKCLYIAECENVELQLPHLFRNLTSCASLKISDCTNIKTSLSCGYWIRNDVLKPYYYASSLHSWLCLLYCFAFVTLFAYLGVSTIALYIMHECIKL